MLSRVLVLVAFACLLVESAVVNKRHYGGCRRLSQCTAALQTYVHDHDGVSTYLSLSDEDVLNNYCQRKSQLDDCFEDASDSCYTERVVSEAEVTVAIAEYICSDTGRQATLALASSECATNEVTQLQVRDDIRDCLVTFEGEVVVLTLVEIFEGRDHNPTDLCPLLESWTHCTVTAAESNCGTEYADVISDILDVIKRTLLNNPPCQNVANNKRQLLGSAMDVLKRSPTKRALSNTIELIAAGAIPGLK